MSRSFAGIYKTGRECNIMGEGKGVNTNIILDYMYVCIERRKGASAVKSSYLTT